MITTICMYLIPIASIAIALYALWVSRTNNICRSNITAGKSETKYVITIHHGKKTIEVDIDFRATNAAKYKNENIMLKYDEVKILIINIEFTYPTKRIKGIVLEIGARVNKVQAGDVVIIIEHPFFELRVNQETTINEYLIFGIEKRKNKTIHSVFYGREEYVKI